MKRAIYLSMRLVHVNVDQMQNVGNIINVDVNANNLLTKVNVMMDLFGILVYANVNVINHAMLENIQIMEVVSLEKRLIDKLVEECSEDIYSEDIM